MSGLGSVVVPVSRSFVDISMTDFVEVVSENVCVYINTSLFVFVVLIKAVVVIDVAVWIIVEVYNILVSIVVCILFVIIVVDACELDVFFEMMRDKVSEAVDWMVFCVVDAMFRFWLVELIG